MFPELGEPAERQVSLQTHSLIPHRLLFLSITEGPENTVKGDSELACRHVGQQQPFCGAPSPAFEGHSFVLLAVQPDVLVDASEDSSGPSALSSPLECSQKNGREKVADIFSTRARTRAGVEFSARISYMNAPRNSCKQFLFFPFYR